MEGNNNNGTYGKIVKFLVYMLFGLTILGILYLLGKYVLWYILPFIIAFVIAAILQPLLNRLCKKTKISRKVISAILVIIVVLLAVGISYVVIDRAIKELGSLANFIEEKVNMLKNDRQLVSEWIAKINSFVPFIDVRAPLEAYWDNISQNMVSLLQQNVSTITNKIVPFLTSALMNLIDGFLVVVIIIVATFYFTSDYKKIREFISIQLKGQVRHYVVLVKNEFVNTIVKFIRAYGLIMFITFIELFIAFSIIGIRYSLLLAFAISLIDILPILGVGTVMIPWGVVLLFTKDYITGIALLSVYLIITIIREIIEPKIVGKYIGLYPLVTLIAMYVGLKAFGLIGLFGLPVLSIILKKLNDEGHIKLWKKPPEGTFFEPTKTGKNKNLNKLFKKKK